MCLHLGPAIWTRELQLDISLLQQHSQACDRPYLSCFSTLGRFRLCILSLVPPPVLGSEAGQALGKPGYSRPPDNSNILGWQITAT